MAVTPASFRARFPEFSAAALTDAVIQGRIEEAERRTPTGVWGTGDFRDDGVAYLTAHLLTLLPNARSMRIEGSEDLYLSNRRRLAQSVVGGFRVVG